LVVPHSGAPHIDLITNIAHGLLRVACRNVSFSRLKLLDLSVIFSENRFPRFGIMP
jgi:hypothetical protein